jgi:hypothetical protein
MIRRLEASRASSPYPNLNLGTSCSVATDTETTVVLLSSDDDENGDVRERGAASHGGWLSPYARSGSAVSSVRPRNSAVDRTHHTHLSLSLSLSHHTHLSAQRAVLRATAASLDASGHTVPMGECELSLSLCCPLACGL